MTEHAPISRRADFLASTEWLAEHLDGSEAPRILDCRYYFDDSARGRRAYLESHIPGAVYLDWTQDISQPRDGLQFMAPSAEHFARAMERLGIGDDTAMVAYDDEGGHYVSRLWLMLRRYGHDHQLRILEGGWTKWTAEGRPTRSGEERAVQSGARFTIDPRRERPDLLLGAEEVLARREAEGHVLVDVRRWAEFTGEEARSKHGGRIPWSKWLLWQDNLRWDAERGFREEAAIRERYEAAGVTADKEVVTYCHGAVRAAHTAFTLTMLGYPDVKVYDGSWEEWGSRDDLPIARGEPEDAGEIER